MPRYNNLHSVNPPEDIDYWALNDPAYDINAFYTTASQDSASPRVRISNKQLSIISALVASKEIPDYRTPADFIRDAIYHRLYWYQHAYRRPDIGRLIRTETEIEQAKVRMNLSAMFDEAIKVFKDDFLLAHQQKNRKGCQEAIGAVSRCLDSEEAEDTRYRAELEWLLAYMKMELETMR